MKPSISFSIISHGHVSLVHRLLAQMNSAPSLRGVRVIVTLNLYDELFDESPYESLDVLVVRNTFPKGFGANHNAAFSFCATDWFGILNPDLVIFGGEPFSPLLSRVTASAPFAADKVGLVAPLVVSANLTTEDSVRSNLTLWSLVVRVLGKRGALKVNGDAKQGRPFFWVAGMCVVVNSNAYRSVSGFDERFFLYCEDYDLCARLYNAGWSIRLDEQALIIHEAQRDSHKSWRYLRMHLFSLVKVWLSVAFWRVTLSSLKN